MPKKRARKAPKTGAVWRQTADEATLAQNPRYNGFACGHGAHGEAKYSRAKAKRAWQKQLKQEGASRGSFPFLPQAYRLRSHGCPPRPAPRAPISALLRLCLRGRNRPLVLPQLGIRGRFAGALAEIGPYFRHEKQGEGDRGGPCGR